MSTILKLCLLLWTTHSASMALDSLAGANFCLSRSETCILLKGCNFQLLGFSPILVGACFEGTAIIRANFSSSTPQFRIVLKNFSLNSTSKCDCSACTTLCSTVKYNTNQTDEKQKSRSRCAASSSPSSPHGTVPSNVLDFVAMANACLALSSGNLVLSQGNNCLLGKFCDIQFDGLQQGEILPPVCIEASTPMILSTILMNPLDTEFIFKLANNFIANFASGPTTVCDCKACDDYPCTTNKLAPLKRILLVKNKIDISNYHELNVYLNQASKSYCPKKLKTFSEQNLEDFICNAPDEIYLVEKVNTKYTYSTFLQSIS